MPREVVITKESSFRLNAGLLSRVETKISISIGEENEIERVIEATVAGGEQSYGRDRLRSELGEGAWKALLAELGATA